MNTSKKQLKNNQQYSTCEECEYKKTCPRYEQCTFLLSSRHKNNHEDITYIENLRKLITPFAGGKFSTGKRDYKTTSDSQDALFSFHKVIVNDALKIIRKGGTAYVYTEQALKDVLCFEPKASVFVKDDIFYIRT